MGWYVHIHVVFPCDSNDGVAALAKKHLEQELDCDEARWFLKELSTRSGENPGPKGGLSLWGIVGNYTDGDEFVESLKPFWKDLFEGVDGGPHDFERALVFIEQEQSESTTVYQIGKDGVTKFEKLPFSTGQY